MTTAKRLQLMLVITILFGLSVMFSIHLLSKVIRFQHLNFIYFKNVSELVEVLEDYPETPLYTSDILERLEKIQQQPIQCDAMINSLDEYMMKMIKTDNIIKLCNYNMLMVSELIIDLNQHKAPMIIDDVLVDGLHFSAEMFNINSKQLEVPIEKSGLFTIKIVSWLVIPFSIFVILTSVIIFRKIHIKTTKLHEAITALESSEEEKKRLAYYDTLTKLPNRNLFTEILEHEIHQVVRYKIPFALLYIDLDRFKFINDTLGHQAGDDLLIQVSKRLNKCIRVSDTLARFGGDEFLLIISGLNSEKNAAIVAKKIIDTVSSPFVIGEHEMHISASIGIVICPENGLDCSILLKRADIAMYEAKANGKNQYHSYKEDTINHKTESRLMLDKDLRHAIEKGELLLYYQPVINLSTNTIVGVEALLRWKHNTMGIISPVDFIPIAEENGMIQKIGEWVISEACKQCKIWRDNGHTEFHVAVNVSALQLKDNTLPLFIRDSLDHYSLPEDALNIEITESVFYSQDNKSLSNLQQLSELGVRLLLDDFGTGYSSLSTLHGLPFDVIKIDRGFMDVHHPKKRIMTQTIIDMAKNFGMQTIAEGVEDQDAADFLKRSGCKYAQGYYFQHPVSVEELDITKVYSPLIDTANVTPLLSKA